MLRKFNLSLLVFIILACGEMKLEETNNYEVSSNHIKSGLYHTLDGIYSAMNEFKTAYPSNVRLYNLGKSTNGKVIPMIRLSFGEEDDAENFLFVSGTHGDEGAPIEGLLFTISKLLDEKVDLELLKKSFNLDFVLIHNPDGYLENERKNKNGIDLNRNFPFGNSESILETENITLIDLINTIPYKSSLFFHSANELKYENMIRRPVEFFQYGRSALNSNMNEALDKLSSVIQKAGNSLEFDVKWSESSAEVDKVGIASDWCVSGSLIDEYKKLIIQECENSHPSLTIELCNTKQPIDESKLNTEKKEAYTIIKSVITEL